MYAGVQYAKIIVGERFLPRKQRTIPPVVLGGFAGGEKYFRGGILFKFALDQPVPSLQQWMYGGARPLSLSLSLSLLLTQIFLLFLCPLDSSLPSFLDHLSLFKLTISFSLSPPSVPPASTATRVEAV